MSMYRTALTSMSALADNAVAVLAVIASDAVITAVSATAMQRVCCLASCHQVLLLLLPLRAS